jgi:hypothetical protein
MLESNINPNFYQLKDNQLLMFNKNCQKYRFCHSQYRFCDGFAPCHRLFLADINRLFGDYGYVVFTRYLPHQISVFSLSFLGGILSYCEHYM